MRGRTFNIILSTVLALSFGLTACQPSSAATQAATTAPAATEAATTAPAATEAATTAPAATEAATTAPATAFEPMKVEAPNCDYGGEFKSIEAVDQYTVKFTLCNPDPAFAVKVPIPAFYIQDKDYLDANGGDAKKMSETPNGTGPYVLNEWVRGDHITLTANPNYWGDKAKTQTLIVRWSDQPSQRLLELQSGTVDGIDNPTPDDFATIQSDPNLKMYTRLGLNMGYVGFNNTIKPFDNVKVRQALAMALDRQRIVDNFYPKGSEVAEGILSTLIKPGASPDIPWYTYDPKAAKALLAEAGFPNGFETTLSYRLVARTYMPLPDKVANEIQAELAEIGVKVKINQMESTAFIDSVSNGKEGLYLLGGNMDYADPADTFNYNFGNPNNKSFGTIYKDIYDETIAAAQLSDADQRQVHYEKANQMIKDEVPLIPLAHGTSATVFKATVDGAQASPLNKEVFSVMSNGTDQLVWMQSAEPAALSCPDETDDETNRVCSQIYEGLLAFAPGTATLKPALAEKWSANTDATEWTFTLRQGVKFQNGASLDANDVVATFVSQWDAKDKNHVGRTGTFEYFGALFGNFLNAK
jgi:peptide/nickel transport system substrate-binding protein